MLQQEALRRAYLLEYRKTPGISVSGKCVQPDPTVNHYVLVLNLTLTTILIPSCLLWYHHTDPSSLMVPSNNNINNSYLR